MKSFGLIRGAAVALATVGMMIPNAPAMAAGQSQSRVQVKKVDAKIFDIAMQGGAFKGRVVDHTGAAIEGAAVTVKQGSKEVARSVTDKNGTFAVSDLKSGVYTVSSGATEGTYRLWAEKSAPPSAKEQSLLVMGENGARGNFGCCDGCMWLVAGIATAGLIVGIVTLTRVNDAIDKIPTSP
jgi:hypothetical protein